jgi:hypothetical protein
VEPAGQEPPAAGVIVAVRVHGNHATPDAEVLAVAALQPGEPADATRLAAAARRLRDSGRFRDVQVLKRFASIDDPSQVVVVLLVEEHAGAEPGTGTPGLLRRLRAGSLWLPVLGYEDGYGLTYGVRLGLADALGGQVSVPLTWGGERRAAAAFTRAFSRGPVTRLMADGGIWRREHPAFEVPETRHGAGVRVERAAGAWLRAGGGARLARVHFGNEESDLVTVAGDLTLDTRRDPAFPRNAVVATGRLERLAFDPGNSRLRRSADVRGDLGLPRGLVLTARGAISSADGPLPPWERAWIGGIRTLRGHRPGARQDDNAAGASLEIRVPVSSPLSFGRVAVRAFVDAAATYAAGTPVHDAVFSRGVGAGLSLGAALFNADLDVARAVGGGWRVHVLAGVGRP